MCVLHQLGRWMVGDFFLAGIFFQSYSLLVVFLDIVINACLCLVLYCAPTLFVFRSPFMIGPLSYSSIVLCSYASSAIFVTASLTSATPGSSQYNLAWTFAIPAGVTSVTMFIALLPMVGYEYLPTFYRHVSRRDVLEMFWREGAFDPTDLERSRAVQLGAGIWEAAYLRDTVTEWLQTNALQWERAPPTWYTEAWARRLSPVFARALADTIRYSQSKWLHSMGRDRIGTVPPMDSLGPLQSRAVKSYILPAARTLPSPRTLPPPRMCGLPPPRSKDMACAAHTCELGHQHGHQCLRNSTQWV